MTAIEPVVGPPRPQVRKILIRTEQVCRYYHVGDSTVKAVDEVTWEVPEGKLFTLRGRSGSGKTTLLNLIGALDKPTAGNVFFEDKDLGRMTDGELTRLRRHRMGFVFQAFALIPVLTAYENVELSMRIAGVGARQRHERAIEALTMVGLDSRLNHRSFELSGGEQQRVSIARAIANNPSLLIADEPTGELDSVTGLEIMMLFRRVVDDSGITLVMATHDPALSQFADETFLMEDGRLTKAEGPLDFDLPDLVQRVELLDAGSSADRQEPEAAPKPAEKTTPRAADTEADHSRFKRRS